MRHPTLTIDKIPLYNAPPPNTPLISAFAHNPPPHIATLPQNDGFAVPTLAISTVPEPGHLLTTTIQLVHYFRNAQTKP